MATIQTRTNKAGRTTYRVGFYEDGRFQWLPALAHEAGAQRIKAIVEDPRQGPTVARRILEAQVDSAPGMPTLAEFFPRYIEHRGLRCSPGTLAGYEAEAARTFLPRLGELPVDMIDRRTVAEWIRWQLQQPTARWRAAAARAAAATPPRPEPPLATVSPKTVRNAHALLSAVLGLAVQEGILPANPARGADLPDDDVEEERGIFSRTEWARFYAAMSESYQPLLIVLLVTGARWGEATALQVRDLDVAARVIHVRRAWKKGKDGAVLGVPKTARGRRTIMLPDWAVETLEPLAAGRAADEFLLTAPGGGVIHRTNFVERHWKPALAAAGIAKHLTPHSLRHTFASWALMDGVPAQVVQHRLGHESLQTTSRVYAHLLLDAQRAAVDAIGWEPSPGT
ncbi:site-specific integrase [Micrococcus luteus]|uniref:tyrosine-type recombinase/integrase n=1 Tax=Micrococcus luteus TaxID=1270 RepID=UPI0019108D2F|nr:site-specific integrase [Micrococcus luteus]QQE48103.1 site-specific integrase [Micrococcus luteus]